MTTRLKKAGDKMNATKEEPENDNRQFGIHVVLTTSKDVKVHPREQIEKVKETSLDKFSIPKSNAPQYFLSTSPGNPASRLDDTKTVEECGINADATLYLIKPHNDA
jgi:hypothetical protein